MKTKPDTAATLRSIVRWTTGAAVGATIIAGTCMFFPILSSLPALGLTICLSLFIGLNIALPPMDPEEDWVPIRSKAMEESSEEAVPAAKEEKASSRKPSRIDSIPDIEVLPTYARRSNGAPTGTWHVVRPGLKHDEEEHKITLTHRYITGKRHKTQFPAQKTG